MNEFINILPYLAIGDWVFLLSLAFAIFLIFASFGNEDLWGLTSILIVILGTIFYFNYIPYGVYQAKNIEVNGKVIGENTKRGISYEFDMDKEYIRKDSSRYKLPYCEKKSNIYVNVYCSKYNRIIVTKMGTIKSIHGNDKRTQAVYTINLNY
jgi:hypothetical protein